MKVLSWMALAIHLVALSVGLYYQAWVLQNLHPKVFSGHGAFLTQWSHTLENLFFAVIVIDELFALFGKKLRLGKFTDAFFSVIFPLTAMVGVIFWGLYFYNRDLILTKEAEKVYPAHVNIYQHGIVAVWMWIEPFIRRHRNVEPRNVDILIAPAVGLIYILWSTFVAYMSDWWWPYPFQRTWPFTGVLALYVAALFITMGVVYLKRALLSALERHLHSKISPSSIESKITNAAGAAAKKAKKLL